MTTATLLRDIETFLAQTGMGSSYFGKRACGDTELVKRLRRSVGGQRQRKRSVGIDTATRVRDFMAQYRSQRGLPLPEEDSAVADRGAEGGAS